MTMNPLLQLQQLGQSLWLDYIQRGMLNGGELQRMVDEDGLRGVTSNPAILQHVIMKTEDYTDAIAALAPQCTNPEELYEALALEDIRGAAQVLRPVYDKTQCADGYVSLEVSPHLAYDTNETVKAARRLWHEVDQPNLMIKVPATKQGLPAISTLIADGLNINVTLIFGLDRYRAVAEAYIEGLRRRFNSGKPLSGIASVASFFISRIDNVIDQKLDALKDGQEHKARALRGEVAIAGAREAYRMFTDIFAGPAWQELQKAGAQPQRLLWASTSAKDPTFSEVKYVEELIGPQTVNTLPPATLIAYRKQGKPAVRITSTDPDPARILGGLKELDIDIDKIMSDLEDDGVEKFKTAYDQLLNAIAKQLRAVG